MNDNIPSEEDPIVAEVRTAREQIGSEFDFDLRLILEDAMRRQTSSDHCYGTPSSIESGHTKQAS